MIMRKSFLMLGMAVAALTSCTQSEVLEIAESRVIGFDSFVGKHTRTASKIEQTGQQSNDLNMFWVMGYAQPDGSSVVSLFDKVACSHTGTGFTYENPKAWALNTTYNFAAYSNGNNSLTDEQVSFAEVNGSYVLKFNDYKVDDEDLLAAIVPPFKTNDTGSDIPQTVALPFQHMLSCVRITITNASDKLYLKFGDVTIKAIGEDNCTYKIDNNTKTCVWENTTSAASAVSATEKDYTFKAPTTNEGYVAPGSSFQDMLFFIPQSNNIEFEVDIETYEKNNNGEYIKRFDKKSTASLLINDDLHKVWQPGYQYNYAASVAGEVHYIRFSATVDSWTPNEIPLNGASSAQN